MIMEFIDSKFIEEHYQILIAQAENFLQDGQISPEWKWVPSPPLLAPFNPVFDEIRNISKANGIEKIFSYPLSDNLFTDISCISPWPCNTAELKNIVRKLDVYMSIVVFDKSADWVLLVDPDEIIFLGGKLSIMSQLKTTIDDIKKSILSELPDFAFPLPNHLEIVPIDVLFKRCGISC